eukprot:g48385.t1
MEDSKKGQLKLTSKKKATLTWFVEIQHADDNVPSALSEQNFQASCNSFTEAYRRIRLSLNLKKMQSLYQSQILHISWGDRDTNVSIPEADIEAVTIQSQLSWASHVFKMSSDIQNKSSSPAQGRHLNERTTREALQSFPQKCHIDSIAVANGYSGLRDLADAPSIDAILIQWLCVTLSILLPLQHGSWGHQPVAGFQSELPALAKDGDIEEQLARLNLAPLPGSPRPGLGAALPSPPDSGARYQ